MNHALVANLNVANTSFNAIRENKFSQKFPNLQYHRLILKFADVYALLSLRLIQKQVCQVYTEYIGDKRRISLKYDVNSNRKHCPISVIEEF